MAGGNKSSVKNGGFILVKREVLEEILRKSEEIKKLVKNSCLRFEK